MRLQIHNDCKEKWESFDARLTDSDTSLYGYGKNKEEAIEELKSNVNKMILELQEIDWESFDWISWKGEILKNDL